MVCLTTLQKLIHSEECQVLSFRGKKSFFAFLKTQISQREKNCVRTEDNLYEQNKHKWDTRWCMFTLYQVWNCRNLNSPYTLNFCCLSRISGVSFNSRFLGPTPRALESEVLEWNPKTCISKKFLQKLDAAGARMTLEKHWHCGKGQNSLSQVRWKSSWISTVCVTFHRQVTLSLWSSGSLPIYNMETMIITS